jgi:hypothetical protein
VARFSLETASGGGVGEVLRAAAFFPDSGTLASYGVHRRVLQHCEEEGEVSDYPTKGKRGVWFELTMRGDMEARRRQPGRSARTRDRGERGRGDGGLVSVTPCFSKKNSIL